MRSIARRLGLSRRKTAEEVRGAREKKKELRAARKAEERAARETEVRAARQKRSTDPLVNPLEGVQALLSSTRDDIERKFYQHVLETFDFVGFARIQVKHSVISTSRGYWKFLDFPHYLKLRYGYVRDLGLDRSEPLKILDLASGACHFAYICDYFGHDVTCLDVPDNQIFNDIINVIGVNRISEAILPSHLLPATDKFDLVTAFHATFHKKRNTKTLFTLAEWRFFFEDLIGNHMSPRGKINLHLDRLANVAGVHVFDPEFISFIEESGGTVEGQGVIFDDVSRYPSDWLATSAPVASGEADTVADAINVLLIAGCVPPTVKLANEGNSILLEAPTPDHASAALRAYMEAGEDDRAFGLADRISSILNDQVLKAINNLKALKRES